MAQLFSWTLSPQRCPIRKFQERLGSQWGAHLGSKWFPLVRLDYICQRQPKSAEGEIRNSYLLIKIEHEIQLENIRNIRADLPAKKYTWGIKKGFSLCTHIERENSLHEFQLQ